MARRLRGKSVAINASPAAQSRRTSSRPFSSARSPRSTATSDMVVRIGSASGCSTPSCTRHARGVPRRRRFAVGRRRVPSLRRAAPAAGRGLPRHRPRRAPAPVRRQECAKHPGPVRRWRRLKPASPGGVAVRPRCPGRRLAAPGHLAAHPRVRSVRSAGRAQPNLHRGRHARLARR